MKATDKPQSLRVFLCHSAGDKPAVRELYQRLCAEGIDAWLDEEKLLPGQDWQHEIPKAVRASDVVIVCLSRSSVTKAGYFQKEIKFALDVADEQPEGAIFLIPTKLEECEVPDRLSRWEWVGLYETRGYDRLMLALRARAETLGISLSHVPIYLSGTVKKLGGIEFVFVPKSKFIMGSKDDNGLATIYEKPQHTIEISYDYWIARHPVTNDQFAEFVEATQYVTQAEKEREERKQDSRLATNLFSPEHHDWRHPSGLTSNVKNKGDYPVVQVSWHDAIGYCKWLDAKLHSEISDLEVRLPTEAEWEKAARGEHGNEWPWGNDFDSANCNSSEGGRGNTTPVGTYSPQGDSPYSAADMAGNVWEWCHSLFDRYPYKINDGRENESALGNRVMRGGSFDNDRICVRVAYRTGAPPESSSWGFRPVIAPWFPYFYPHPPVTPLLNAQEGNEIFFRRK
jgi:formylglycine-generating enzyme required for sulfatase activity